MFILLSLKWEAEVRREMPVEYLVLFVEGKQEELYFFPPHTISSMVSSSTNILEVVRKSFSLWADVVKVNYFFNAVIHNFNPPVTRFFNASLKYLYCSEWNSFF